MTGLTPEGKPVYRCRLYHAGGSSSCYCNSIPEGPLVKVVAQKIRERYLSEAALARLRRKIEGKLAEEDRPLTRRELARLRREIELLDRKIDQGADRVLDAPAEIVPVVYRKLEEHRAERDRLKAALESLTSRGEQSSGKDGSKIDQMIEALRGLREALETAKPEDSKNLLTSIITRIELHFDHELTEGGRHRNTFSHGTIYVRPDAGEARSSDAKSTHLSTIPPNSRTELSRLPLPLPRGACVGFWIELAEPHCGRFDAVRIHVFCHARGICYNLEWISVRGHCWKTAVFGSCGTTRLRPRVTHGNLPMVHPSLPRYRYTVDAHDIITSVSPTWLAFARENGAPELTDEAVTGHSLWDFIDGAETIELYQAILQRVRTRTLRIVVPFRCDSPTLRRFMRLEITCLPKRSVQFDGLVERAEPTGQLNLLDPSFPRSRNVLTLCSCCKRAMVEPYGWLEIEDAAARLHLLEEERSPQLRHAVCPDCLTAARLPP